MSLFARHKKKAAECTPWQRPDERPLQLAKQFAEELSLPDDSGQIRLRLMTGEEFAKKRGGQGKAPWYLLILAEEGERNYLNAGYAAGQASAYLRFHGIETDILRPFPEYISREERKCMTAVALGGRRTALVKEEESSRDQNCICCNEMENWFEEVLVYSRWQYQSGTRSVRTVRSGNEAHFLVKETSVRKNAIHEFEAGIAIANFMEAAEELWIDLEMVRMPEEQKCVERGARYLVSVRKEHERK